MDEDDIEVCHCILSMWSEQLRRNKIECSREIAKLLKYHKPLVENTDRSGDRGQQNITGSQER